MLLARTYSDGNTQGVAANKEAEEAHSTTQQHECTLDMHNMQQCQRQC